MRTLCKQAQKSMKGCSLGIGVSSTPGKFDMGSSAVPFSSINNVGNVRSFCKQTKKLMKVYLKRLGIKIYQIIDIKCSVVGFWNFTNAGNVRFLCKQTPK